VKRREFITLVCGTAVCPLLAPRAAPAQEASKQPVIGYLYSGSRALNVGLPGFTKGLREAGLIEGQNIRIVYRFAEGQIYRVPGMAAELVAQRVDVIFAGDNAASTAAKGATATIPIVFWVGGDPIKMGLVPSLNRPGGNMTGMSGLSIALVTKKIQLLHDMVPGTRGVGLLVNPANPGTAADTAEAEEAARALGLQLHVLKVSSEREIDAAFDGLAQRNAGALLLQGDPFLTTRINQLIELSRRHRVATTYYLRSHVEAGGLMSYAPSIIDLYRDAAGYVARIIKGEKPADLPVQLATKVELVINRKTAVGLSLDIPATLLAVADEVIE
jgi:putative ABC transport system substrate-binding protein